MTCFWNTIINKLKNKDLIYLFNYNSIGNPIVRSVKPDHFAHLLIKNNMKTNNVLWQNKDLTEKEKEENLEHIKSFDIRTINNGYLCSICDPFILLICHLFKISIIHFYNNIKIEYKNKIKNRYIIILKSDNGHMW